MHHSISEYTDENPYVSGTKLFCLACQEELSVKSLVINITLKVRNASQAGKLKGWSRINRVIMITRYFGTS